ncbi:MAG: hypothetical protein INH34_06255 [Phycisphaerales bacterium]|jgi:predicted RNA polymerase sigma factor|nr:hypothetical protein [Phycisphaerales bacterium]
MDCTPQNFLPVAFHAATQVVRCRVLAEEASERALHLLTLAHLHGHPPLHPYAWVRRVARRAACGLLRSEWGRTRRVDDAVLQAHASAVRTPPDYSLEQLHAELEPALTPRQRQAFAAIRTCNGTRAAARSCGMDPRDFRRSLQAISRKARALGLAPEHAAGDAADG